MTCPAGIDCLWIESKLAEALRGFKSFSVIDAERVRQVLFELGASQVTPENLAAVNEELGTDALFFALVGSTSSGAVGVMVGTSLIMVPDEVKHSGVEVRWVAPDGTTLLQGIGSGTSGNVYKSGKGVVLTTFKAVLVFK